MTKRPTNHKAIYQANVEGMLRCVAHSLISRANSSITYGRSTCKLIIEGGEPLEVVYKPKDYETYKQSISNLKQAIRPKHEKVATANLQDVK